ncbi:MAG: thiamine phosphate synthase [Terriglobales bacterium]
MKLVLPKLYAIVDAGCFAGESDPTMAVVQYARELVGAGVELIQYRNKAASARVMLSQAREIRRAAGAKAPSLSRAEATRLKPCPGTNQDFAATAEAVALRSAVRLIMNDRADLCLAAGFDGVHVGQDDLSPAAARMIVGESAWVGVSTHNPEQVAEADGWPVDYIAVGPVFATASKANPDPVIGVEGVRQARALTRRPLVAIGGITRANCRAVIEAGADSVAVISDLLREPARAVVEFLQRLAS